MKRLPAVPLMAALFLSGCASELYGDMDAYMKVKRIPAPTEKSFAHCEGYGCPGFKLVELNERDWKKIETTFGGKAHSALEERNKIARAVGEFERIVGPLTGTEQDKRGTFVETGKGQLDCVDESTNTTIYMMLLQQKGLIDFHGIEHPQVRYPIISGRGWMHQTAVITDKETGKQYAVDSWFEDNGVNPWVVSLDAWMAGWHPSLLKDKGELPVSKDAKSP